jgi:chemotaxis protein methyltransferase CheR
MSVEVQLRQLTDVQLAQFAELVYRIAGIKISSQKHAMLSNRLRRRLKANKLDDFDQYLTLLKTRRADDPEWDAFLQEVSTHETYLFRDRNHWDWFETEFLPTIVDRARSGQSPKSLRVWSAACSTGDEAHTIATCIAANISDHAQWKIAILGTDIGVGAVRQAQRGKFNERAMQAVPESLRRKYFDASTDGKMWQVRQSISRWMSFRQHNLLDRLAERPFDVVFLKNVLIYFDSASKKRVLSNVIPLLAPGGFLVTAAAEGVTGLVNDLSKVKPWLYQKLASANPLRNGN